jgi:hypothetical protein
MALDPVATRRFIEALSTHLEDHLATWKSSLADTRREVDTILTAAGERIPAQARSLFPEDIVQLLLEDVMPPPEKVVETVVETVVERVEVLVPSVSSNWSLVRSSLSAIESARTQVDVLTRFLSEANAHASRVALLVLRNDRITGWKAIGFDVSGGKDDAVKGLDLPADADPFAAAVLRRERSMIAVPPDEDSPLRRALGGAAPTRTFVVPMVIRDRIAGLLVGDELPGEEKRLDTAALEVLTFATGLSVDLLAARKKIPSPTLTPTGDQIPVFEIPPKVFDDPGATIQAVPFPFGPMDSPAPAAVPPPPPPSFSFGAEISPKPSPLPEQTGAPRERSRITDAGDALRVLEQSASSRPKPDVPPSGPGQVTIAFDQLRAPAPPAPALAPPPPPAPARISWDAPVAAPQPPIPVREPSTPRPIPSGAASSMESTGGPVSGPVSAPPGFVPRIRSGREEDPARTIEDARRLARLLVSEIKLYNEKKVEDGRANMDLYGRLKDDIERSRQVYNERTPESVRQNSNFFHDELVRILADGRPEVLGQPT